MQRLLSKSETSELVGIHNVSLMRLVRQGRFPKPIKLSHATNSRVRFLPQDVTQWIEARKASAALDVGEG